MLAAFTFITDHRFVSLPLQGNITTLKYGWLGDKPVFYITVISPWEMDKYNRRIIVKGELERKIGVIPRNLPKALAMKAFSERIQIDIERLKSTLLTPLPHLSC